MNFFKTILIGTGVFFGIRWVMQQGRTSKYLETWSDVNIHKIGLDGLTLRVNARLKNPTGGKISIKHPHVRLGYKGELIGSASISAENSQRVYELGARSETTLDPIFIRLKFLDMAGAASDLISLVRGKLDKMTVQVEILTEVKAGLVKLPYEKVENKTITL